MKYIITALLLLPLTLIAGEHAGKSAEHSGKAAEHAGKAAEHAGEAAYGVKSGVARISAAGQKRIRNLSR